MTIKESLIWGKGELLRSLSAPLDARLLLQYVLDKRPEYLFAYPEQILTQAQVDLYDELHRHILQTKALAATLSCEDILSDLPEAHVASVLWLLTDRVADIEDSAVAFGDAIWSTA